MPGFGLSGGSKMFVLLGFYFNVMNNNSIYLFLPLSETISIVTNGVDLLSLRLILNQNECLKRV